MNLSINTDDSPIYSLQCQPTSEISDIPYPVIEDMLQRDGMTSPGNHVKHLVYHSDRNGNLKFIFNLKHINQNGTNGNVCKLGVRVRIIKTNDSNVVEDIDIFDPNIFTSTGYTTILNVNDLSDEYEDYEYQLDPSAITGDYISNNFSLIGEYQVSKSRDRIEYITPIVMYYNIGDLRINTITITDQLYEDIDNGNHDTEIISRLNDMNGDNLLALYSYDEPTPTLFNVYGKLEEIITDNSNLRLETAVNSSWWNKDEQPEDIFSNIDLFNYEADPEIITTDIYLYGNDKTLYNQVDTNDPEGDGSNGGVWEGNIQ